MIHLKLSDFRKKIKLKFHVNRDRFIVAKLARAPEFSEDVFSIVRDEKEVTVVAKEGFKLSSISEEKFFKLITFDVTLPFNLTGFLSHISALLASKNIPILAFSAYSTDHILVREEDLESAIAVLEKDGIEGSRCHILLMILDSAALR